MICPAPTYAGCAGDDQRLAVLPPHDVSMTPEINHRKRGNSLFPAVQKTILIHKLYQIGKSLLVGHDDRAALKPSNAIDWLRNAFRLVDHLEEATSPDTRELRVRPGNFNPLLSIFHSRVLDILTQDNGLVDVMNSVSRSVVLISPSPTQPEPTS